MSDTDAERNYGHETRKQVVPAAGSLFRWVIAALVTINGGALITLTQQSNDNFAFLRASGTYFGLGLILVILGGLAGFFALFLLGAVMHDPEDMKPDKPATRSMLVMTLLAAGLGLTSIVLPVLSLGAFSAGGMRLIDTVNVKAAADASAKAKLKKAPLCRPTPVAAMVPAGKPL